MDLETWAIKNSKLATADDLIEGAILADIAKNFSDWEYSEKPESNHDYINGMTRWNPAHDSFSLVWKDLNAEKVASWVSEYAGSIFGVNRYLSSNKIRILYQINTNGNISNVTINGVRIADKNGNRIITGYFKLKKQLDEANRVAEEAKKEMELDKKKWNLAEKLLGMKRNEFGALVPIEVENLRQEVNMTRIKRVGNILAGRIQGFFPKSHGGGCCGIRHLYSFPIPSYYYDMKLYCDMKEISLGEKKEIITKGLTACIDVNSEFDCCSDCDSIILEKRKNWRCAVEVVLIPEQVEYWGEALEAVGFKEVFSFFNSNSGNRCHIFYIETNAQSDKELTLEDLEDLGECLS